MKIIGLMLILISAGAFYFFFYRRADNIRNDASAIMEEAINKHSRKYLTQFPRPDYDSDPEYQEARARAKDVREHAVDVLATGIIVGSSGLIVGVGLIVAGFIVDFRTRRRVERERWGRD
jgi:hypothetical protein